MYLSFVVFLCSIFAVRAFDVECDPVLKRINVSLAVNPTGNLYSPGYKKNGAYPTDVSCRIQLLGIPNSYIRLRFNDFDVETNGLCIADNVAVYDINDRGALTFRGRFCGNIKVHDIVSTTSRVLILFQSDFMTTGRGFNITYSVSRTRDVCSTGQFQCRNRKCLPNLSEVCDGVDACGDGTDEENCNYPLQTSEKCGTPEVEPFLSNDIVDRIVGGQKARPGSWPWQVDMQSAAVHPNGHFCGGALLNTQWFVTAAHCFMNSRLPYEIRIHVGNHHKFENDPHEQVRYVKDYFVYGVDKQAFIKTGEFNITHDVALGKLNAPVRLNPHVQLACLPNQNEELKHKTKCYATGWGWTRGSGGDDVLKQAQHPIQKESFCRSDFQKFENETMICAGRLEALNGLCHGDSGGPLICQKNGKWHVYGVASYVTDSNFQVGLCGLENRPTVFNKLSKKINWILSIISQN